MLRMIWITCAPPIPVNTFKFLGSGGGPFFPSWARAQTGSNNASTSDRRMGGCYHAELNLSILFIPMLFIPRSARTSRFVPATPLLALREARGHIHALGLYR